MFTETPGSDPCMSGRQLHRQHHTSCRCNHFPKRQFSTLSRRLRTAERTPPVVISVAGGVPRERIAAAHHQLHQGVSTMTAAMSMPAHDPDLRHSRWNRRRPTACNPVTPPCPPAGVEVLRGPSRRLGRPTDRAWQSHANMIRAIRPVQARVAERLPTAGWTAQTASIAEVTQQDSVHDPVLPRALAIACILAVERTKGTATSVLNAAQRGAVHASATASI